MDIREPVHPIGDINRALECEENMHPALGALLASAVKAGWTVDEVLIAIEEVVKEIRTEKPTITGGDGAHPA
jgi:hypothetical protein